MKLLKIILSISALSLMLASAPIYAGKCKSHCKNIENKEQRQACEEECKSINQ